MQYKTTRHEWVVFFCITLGNPFVVLSHPWSNVISAEMSIV